jgi:hypothetical protein
MAIGFIGNCRASGREGVDMQRAKRWAGYVIAVALGAMTVDLTAQLLEFSDGTYGTKAVIYSLAGTEVDFSAIGLGATPTANLAAIELATEATETALESAATGDTPVRKVSGADGDVADDEFAICTAACTITAIDCFNSNATTDAYFKMTNATAANTTPGSTAVAIGPVLIPFGPGSHRKTMFVAMTTAATGYFSTGSADSDATDVPNGEVFCTVEKR